VGQVRASEIEQHTKQQLQQQKLQQQQQRVIIAATSKAIEIKFAIHR
jgi:hypothetical protein